MRRYVHFRLGLVLCCLAVYLGTMAVPGTHTKAAPGASEPIAQQVTVSPAKVFFGERLEITVKGFPPDYTLPAGSVTFAGLRLPVPGYFGAPGERPKSDVLGNLTFRTYLPMDTPLGSQLLMADSSAAALSAARQSRHSPNVPTPTPWARPRVPGSRSI